MRGLLQALAVTVLLALTAGAQGPSQEEQQYLLSVVPLIDQGDLARAEEHLAAGIKQYPTSAILHNALGIVYRKQGNNEKAAASFRAALEILPSFTAAQLQLAALSEKAEAVRLFRAAGGSTTDFDALMTAGLGLADLEDYQGATVIFKKAQGQRPDAMSARYNLALAEYKAGELEAAREALASAGSVDADVVYLRGKILEALRNSDSSATFARACRMQPADETYCASAAVTAIQHDRLGEAIELVRQAIEKSPGSVLLLSAQALAQFRLGRYAEAISSYRAALEKEPGLDAAREGLAFVYYMTGDLEKARAVTEEGLKNQTADFYLAHLDGMILFRLSPALHDRALTAVERAIRENPRFAPSYFLRGKIRMELGNLNGALEDFEKAVRLDPNYPLPYYKMAQLYARLGRARESEDARKRFVELGSLREEETLTRQTQNVLMPGNR